MQHFRALADRFRWFKSHFEPNRTSPKAGRGGKAQDVMACSGCDSRV